MAVSTSEDSDVLSEINITPLVDVMLVLLVAFVITIPALTNAIHVNLPRTVNTTPPEQQKAIEAALLKVATRPDLLKVLETKLGFVQLDAQKKSP